jgi:hypothetical protein
MAQIVYRLKVDSTGKSSMGFDEGKNVLYPRSATVVPVVSTPKPPAITVSRPSRRSIIQDAREHNDLRGMLQ